MENRILINIYLFSEFIFSKGNFESKFQGRHCHIVWLPQSSVHQVIANKRIEIKLYFESVHITHHILRLSETPFLPEVSMAKLVICTGLSCHRPE